MGAREQAIDDIRHFNRHYIPLMHLLEPRYLDTGYSTMECDILFEISAHRDCTATELVGLFGVDKGYLSRMLSTLERDGLIERRPSDADRRARLLRLTDKGGAFISELTVKGREVVGSALLGASDDECAEMAACMRRVLDILDAASRRGA